MTTKNRSETGVINDATFNKIMKTFGNKKPKKSLKLYVWEGSLCDWTSGIMFALAENVKEARALILKQHDSEFVRDDLAQRPKVYHNKKVGFQVFGGG